jgi:hypothetical protein
MLCPILCGRKTSCHRVQSYGSDIRYKEWRENMVGFYIFRMLNHIDIASSAVSSSMTQLAKLVMCIFVVFALVPMENI